MTRKELGEQTCRNVEQIGMDFKNPDDDWAPVLILELHDGSTAVCGLTDLRPEAQPAFCAEAIEKMRPRRVARVSSTWMRIFDVSEPGQKEKAKEYMEEYERGKMETEPGTREGVWVVAIDAEGKDSWLAQIIRRDQAPPTLGAWEHMPGGEGLQVGALEAAFQRV